MKTQFYIWLCLISLAQNSQSQSWHALGPGLNGPVHTIVPHGSDIYVGGAFTDAGGHVDADYLARWDGCEWHAVAPGLSEIVSSIVISGDSIFVIGGFKYIDGIEVNHLAFWDGEDWNALDSLNGAGMFDVNDIAVIDGDVYVNGFFNNIGTFPDPCWEAITKWDGSSWSAILLIEPCTELIDNNTWAILTTDGSDLYLTGFFPAAGSRFARLDLDGNIWHDLSRPGPGTRSYNDGPVIHNQDLYVVESTFLLPTQSFPDYWNIIKWDGQNWTELVTSKNAIGHLVIHKDLLYYWNSGIQRLELNHPTVGAERIADPFSFQIMAADSTNLYVGGNFNSINGDMFFHIARWGDEIDCSVTSEKNVPSMLIPELIVSPNPAHDVIYWSFRTDRLHSNRVTLADITGKVVIDRWTDAQTLQVAHLSPGLYVLNVYADQRALVARVVIE